MMRSRSIAAVLALGALTGAPALAADEDKLIGVWSYETTFGTPIQGELTVLRRNETWRAVVGNLETGFKPEGRQIQFAFPKDAGRFRGTLGEQAIDGFWIRPAASRDPRFPGGPARPSRRR